MNKITIKKDIAKQVLMIGVCYKHNAQGGMESVIKIYNKYWENFRYITIWRNSNFFIKFFYVIYAFKKVFFLLLFDKNIKIIHIHTAAYSSFYRTAIFVNLAKLFRKKVILHIHAGRFNDFYKESSNKAFIIKLLNKCDKLIVLSRSWKDWFSGLGINKTKITILNNIVDYPVIKKEHKKHKKLTFLFLGKIEKLKGIYDLLTVIAKNKKLLGNKILLRIGGYGEIKQLEQFIANKNLSKTVTFLGWVSGYKKIEELNNADVFILPSYNEGLPISILESLSYGLPVISTPVGGISEIVHSGKNGILVTPGNLEEIKNSLLFFVNNKEKTDSYGNESKKIASNFFPDSVMSSLIEIYSKLLN